MSDRFTTSEQTTAGMAEAQLARIDRRDRRRLASAHWAARLGTALVFWWAFSEPSAVGLVPLLLALAAGGGTAAIGNRRLVGADLGTEVRSWIVTGLLGLTVFVGWVNDWPLAGRVRLAESCLLSTPADAAFDCAGWTGSRDADASFWIDGQSSRLVHHEGGAPTIAPNGVSFSTTEVQALGGDWYLVTDLSFTDAGYWF